VFVDTAPVMEKPLAQAAGLGWQGKHTNLVSRDFGSWLFLGEIFTAAELPSDEPEIDHCGSCSACQDICPTAAFPAPYRLDARRCISYLTIEHRGSIPLELRPLIGTHVFGCDICQEVCPVNRVAETRLRRGGQLGAGDDDGRTTRGKRLEFQPRAAVGSSPALIPLLALDEEGFRERFRHSPIKRTKRRGLLRNVCVALGNIGDAAAVPALAGALRDTEPLVRGHAAWALGRIGGEEARMALVEVLATEEDSAVHEEMRYALTLIESRTIAG
jgi:epoxyqueuosine reductase